LGKKLALSAVPLAMGAMFKKAYGQMTPRSVFDVLNFALLLEYLESDFYNAAMPSVPFPNQGNRQGFGIITDHEAKHVKFLIAAITGAGGRPIAKPRFDLSGGAGSGNGPFKNAFTDYNLFLAVAQTLEDTGVRAYKGQAPFLLGTGGVLTAALNIHSVEARHAAHVREERWKHNLIAGLKPWITGNVAFVPGGLVDANYSGEDMTVQAGISITNINGFSVSGEAATESFDEPLSTEQVTALVTPFLVK
ncbi:MAG: ferritin-like domain-containing protein, partial [Sphingobacteriaceae bacterium]|nr:ferritin-like domain-containing protein [Cytophagaceae bacterium]